MAALAFGLGLFLVARGVMQLVMGYELRESHVWGWFIFDGLVSLVLGVLVLAAWPLGSLLFLGIYFGIGLVMSGVHRLMIAVMLRKALPPRDERGERPFTPARA
jgi:uncharacterized membrane protein HdeD (DUF308 family)